MHKSINETVQITLAVSPVIVGRSMVARRSFDGRSRISIPAR